MRWGARPAAARLATLLAACAVAACQGAGRPDHGPTNPKDFGIPPIDAGVAHLAPVRAASGPLPRRFGFGTPATIAQIDSANIDIPADGEGLPPGSGTASDGAAVFSLRCVACHGPGGTGGRERPLVTEKKNRIPGFPFANVPYYIPTVGTYWPYAPTLFSYIRKAMPQNAPGSLTDDQVYGLVAYILWRNDIIGRDSVMNAHTLPAVVMPARGRFVLDRRHGGPEIR